MESAIPADEIPHLPRPFTLTQAITVATFEATGKVPYAYQVRNAEALYYKRDVLCIAGTGSGKTLSFVMLCFLCPDAMVWIVSPLNFIEEQQSEQFRDWGLRAVAVNANTITPKLMAVSSMRIHCCYTNVSHRKSNLASTRWLSRPQKHTITTINCARPSFQKTWKIAPMSRYLTRHIASRPGATTFAKRMRAVAIFDP
jgi:hypothetical protein